jgi:hypothetical protein
MQTRDYFSGMKPIKPLCPVHRNVMTYKEGRQAFVCESEDCAFTFARNFGYAPPDNLGFPCPSKDSEHKMFISGFLPGLAAWQWQCSAENCDQNSEGMSVPTRFRNEYPEQVR